MKLFKLLIINLFIFIFLSNYTFAYTKAKLPDTGTVEITGNLHGNTLEVGEIYLNFYYQESSTNAAFYLYDKDGYKYTSPAMVGKLKLDYASVSPSNKYIVKVNPSTFTVKKGQVTKITVDVIKKEGVYESIDINTPEKTQAIKTTNKITDTASKQTKRTSIFDYLDLIIGATAIIIMVIIYLYIKRKQK